MLLQSFISMSQKILAMSVLDTYGQLLESKHNLVPDTVTK